MFWTRTKVGVASGLIGLMVGIGSSEDSGLSQSDVDEAVAAAKAQIPKQTEDDGGAAEAISALSAVEDELAAARETLTDVKQKAAADLKRAAAERKKAVQAAVKAAVAAERRRLAAAAPVAAAAVPSPQPPTNAGSTDPRFSYCYEANDAGYGNYQRGVDPEYDWYDDNDGDGVVCEF